ncbi:MAG: hypothetical protein VB096_10745 [Pseudoflavonifractor sp.]|nr:hypothetical protein [Pseudoflavonifractor sp.]
MEKDCYSGNEGLLLLASLVSIQLSHQLTDDQLALLAAFFNVLAANMTVLVLQSPPNFSSESGCT